MEIIPGVVHADWLNALINRAPSLRVYQYWVSYYVYIRNSQYGQAYRHLLLKGVHLCGIVCTGPVATKR